MRNFHVKVFSLIVGVCLLWTLPPTPVVAQAELTPEGMRRFYDVYQRLRDATGAPQQVPVLLINSASLILWANTGRRVGLVRQTGTATACELVGGDPVLNTQIHGYLAALTTAKELSAGSIFISNAVTDLFNALDVEFPNSPCELVIYEVSGELIGAMATNITSGGIGEVVLIAAGRQFQVSEGQSAFLDDSSNRQKMLSAIRTLDIKSIISFGGHALVATKSDNTLFVLDWENQVRVDLMGWTNAQTIVENEKGFLFADNSLSLVNDESSYMSVIRKIAFGENAWRPIMRQAPHLTFRRWP